MYKSRLKNIFFKLSDNAQERDYTQYQHVYIFSVATHSCADILYNCKGNFAFI